jgi:hypothetical protein
MRKPCANAPALAAQQAFIAHARPTVVAPDKDHDHATGQAANVGLNCLIVHALSQDNRDFLL